MSQSAKGIGSFGSIALLVSSMTGPGLSTIPPLFQQSGWLAPMFVFVAVAILSSFAAFFIIEVLSSIRGNERFQAKVEFTTVAQLILGKKYHYFFQIILFLALQAVNVASIVLSAQTMDSMLLTLFNGTCGLSISPGRWHCITEHTVLGNSPFSSDDYYIFTFGYLVSALMVVPLGFFSLVENIFVQMTSFIVLCGILIQWIVAFCQEGLETSRLPASGPNSALVLGIVIFNYSYISTIPTWVNDLKPTVNIHKCVSISVIISTIMYILLGVFGAMAYQMSASSDILAILSTQGSTASLVTTYLFPICALVTSIPVFTIVIRQNLVRGQICSNNIAIFLSNILPWLVCIPLQTKDYVGTIQNWSSLFFQSTVNFILPFILYFASRKYKASVVENITEKNPQEPDDVSMYFPEENKSISLRRTSNIHSRLSRMEQSGITKSYPGSPLSFPRSPRSDNPPPAIVLRQDTQANIETLQVPAASPQGSPNILRVPDSPRPRTSNESRPTTTTLASAQGLGITPKTEEASPQQQQQQQPDASPRIILSPQSNRASNLLCSNLSLRNNSAVAPSGIIVTESDIKNEQAIIQPEEEEHPHFMAFKPRPWLNPFYVAVVSSILLGVSVVFMIIYDLTMLGLGHDVLAE